MKLKYLKFALLWALPVLQLHAQTNPSAVTLPFSLNSLSSSTLPSGVAVHRFSSIQTSRTLSPASGGDLPNQGSAPLSNTGGWYHLGNDGIGMLASGTNPAGAVVVAINTTGKTNITVSWICKTIYNQSSRDNSVALQYRVGTSGNFINVGTASTYASAGNPNGHSSGTFTEVLPVGAENQALVQVRWIYWESLSTSGSRDKISVDDISITASTGSSCNAPTSLSASAITTTTANLGWGSVAGASSYEYVVSTSATPPATGTNTTGTTYSAGSLTPGTLYYLHVRTNCGGTFSGWASTSFETSDNETSGEIKLMSYNLLNYSTSAGASREPAYRTVINDVNPDILVIQELSQASAITTFLNNVMNYSSTTYSAGTVIDGPDTDNGIFYKTALFSFISNTAIGTSLRDINAFKLKHLATGDTIIIYSVHLKASNTTADQNQRTAEVDVLRGVTDALPSGKFYMVCGDFNIYGASEDAYVHLTQAGSNPAGNFNDVLSLSGTWNNSAYAIHHTQSPRTTSFGGGATGGLDDRFDMILFSDAIADPGGFDVVSGSYLAYGNDGMHYNAALNTPPYTMYSSTIAAALHDASDHLPVVVRLSYASGAMVAKPAQPEGGYPAGKNNHLMQDVVRVFPNPAKDQLTIQLTQTMTEPAHFTVSDMTGRMVHQFDVNNNTQTISLPALKPGVYFLQSDLTGSSHKLLIEE
jgi:endonuclease/exonuclease/phosphatase family metal-dependent hydrolase